MGAYLRSASQYITPLTTWIAALQQSLDSAMMRAEGAGTPGSARDSGTGLAVGVIIAIVAVVIVVCLLPICVIAVLTLLGPAIGNVFSNINSNI